MDICVRRILELCVRSPKMNGVAFSNKPDLKAHAQVTRQSAAEGMVLLKNSGVLPLHNINKVALFGVNSYDFLHCGCGSGNVNVPYVLAMVQGLKKAGIGTTQTLTDIYQKYVEYARVKFEADREPTKWFQMPQFGKVALFGVNSYDFLHCGCGSGNVNVPYVIDMVQGLKNAGIGTTKTLTDIYQKYVEYARVKFEADRETTKWFQMPQFGKVKLPEIEISQRCINETCPEADAAIITIGRQAGEGMDRDVKTEFNLTDIERDMIFRVSDAFRLAGKPVIVILNSGSVVETISWRDRVDAILMAWQPGEEGGNTVADILTGKVCPSGKLTMTWPVTASDHPSTANFPQDDKIGRASCRERV